MCDFHPWRGARGVPLAEHPERANPLLDKNIKKSVVIMQFPVNVLSSALIGYIPFRESLRHPELESYFRFAKQFDAAFRSFRTPWSMYVACDQLFYSGNDTPPDGIFFDLGEFRSYLRRKDYRGALAIHSISIDDFDGTKYPVRVETLTDRETLGYTPYGIPAPPRRFWRQFRLHGKGYRDGAPRGPRIEQRLFGEEINISLEVKFRIGRLGNLISRLLTGAHAPNARMSIRYTIDMKRKLMIIKAEGSSIPSQLYGSHAFSRNVKFAGHNMLRNDEEMIRGFLGNAVEDAPLVVAHPDYTYRWCPVARDWVAIN
jgi:hypothetical protein